MWGKRKKRRARLSRQLALGLLEDAMGRVQQPREQGGDEPAAPYPGASPPLAGPASQPGMRAGDVPVDNSAGPESPAADDDPDPVTPPQRQRPARGTGDSSRHGTSGRKNHG